MREFLSSLQGVHLHTYGELDLAEEMSHVKGAIVVRRPALTRNPSVLAPAHSLDFVATLQTHFLTSENSLLRHDFYKALYPLLLFVVVVDAYYSID